MLFVCCSGTEAKFHPVASHPHALSFHRSEAQIISFRLRCGNVANGTNFWRAKRKLAKENSSAITFASVYVGWRGREWERQAKIILQRKRLHEGKKLMEILSKFAVSCSLRSCGLKIFVI